MHSVAIPRKALFTAAAFLVAPLVASFALALAGVVRDDSSSLTVVDVLLWTFIFYFYAALATFVFGLPTFIAFSRLGIVRWWSTSIAGFVAGAIVLIIIDPRGLNVVAEKGIWLWGGTGALSALVFWLVWKRGQDYRPDGT
jgi:hypothetical protein